MDLLFVSFYSHGKHVFSRIYSAATTQNDIFENEIQPVLHRVLEGHKACVLAYGASSSGKTYTLIGPDKDPGIIPRTVATLFEAAEIFISGQTATCPGLSVTIEMSYLEIHDDRVVDLCAHATQHLPDSEISEGEPHGAEPVRVLLHSADHFARHFLLARLARSAVPATRVIAAAARANALVLHVSSSDGQVKVR
jgi:kinesin family member 22